MIFSSLYFLLTNRIDNVKSDSRAKKGAPRMKDYSNYYVYLNDLDEWNDKIYNEYLDFCSKEGKIPLDKEVINRDLELRKIRYNNLIK